jgi:hypothetical protein
LFRALLSVRKFGYAMHDLLILRSGPKDRVSKDAQAICRRNSCRIPPMLHPRYKAAWSI